MSGGGGSTTTQKADPWGGVQPYLVGDQSALGIYPEAQKLYQAQPWTQDMQSVADSQQSALSGRDWQTGQAYDLAGQSYSGAFDPSFQRVGNISGPGATATALAGPAVYGQGAGASAGRGQFDLRNLGLGSSPNDAYTRMLTGRADTSTLDPVVNSATRRLTDNFNEQVMPGINQGATAAGQYGSSRHGVAQGLAAKGLAQSMGDMTGGMYNNAYNQAQGLMGNAAGQLGGFSTSIANNNAGLETQANIASANNSTQASLANAAAANALNQFNAGQQNNMAQFDATNAFNTQQFNANLGLQNNSQAAANAAQMLGNRQAGLGMAQSGNALADQNYQQQLGLLNAPNDYNWQNLNRYSSIVSPGAGIGGTSTSSQNPSTLQNLGNLGNLGLGAYGSYLALSAM